MSESMIERVAKAIYEKRNGAGCKPWSLQTKAHKGPYLDDAKAAIEAMREPAEGQLDAVRRIVQWHNFDRPTEASLIRHCKALGKEPPAECRDVEHVPPTNMASYWIYSGMIDAALKDV